MTFQIISPKYGIKEVLIDDKDYNKIKNYRWYIYKKPTETTFYVRSSIYHNKKRGVLLLHRIILEAKKGQIIDHINRNGLDNRKSNLRFCTVSQNSINSKCYKNSTTKIKGVSYFKCTQNGRTYHYWTARIYINKKAKSLGYFKDSLSAAKAYRDAAIKHYGEFGEDQHERNNDSFRSVREER